MNLVERVKNILFSPKTEWQSIAAETTDLKTLYTGYVMILAAVPAAAGFIGTSLIGFAGFRVPASYGLASAIVGYGLGLVSVYVLALIIDALAPSFGGEKNFNQALKTAAYSSTAAWVAGVFVLIPALAVLSLLGIYSIYLMYLGLPVMMKAPHEKAIGYTVVAVVCAIVLNVVVSAVSSAFIPTPAISLPNFR